LRVERPPPGTAEWSRSRTISRNIEGISRE
jgi:hypothetical protein